MVTLGFYPDLNVWTTFYSTNSDTCNGFHLNGHIGFSFTDAIHWIEHWLWNEFNYYNTVMNGTTERFILVLFPLICWLYMKSPWPKYCYYFYPIFKECGNVPCLFIPFLSQFTQQSTLLLPYLCIKRCCTAHIQLNNKWLPKSWYFSCKTTII